ncbi:pentatricopeptide repeat-containing protein At1g80880, mitochondrial [Amborella trichopoda]|nr:pentatricopeptide repeat-containing protein At1g80880, mitochondrial [Amborella trichopoda]|eukprot:XP_006845366.2 pentatricopeptide repeat-containing protein At1g80880, mitochondrial [Amborella trichopoda]
MYALDESGVTPNDSLVYSLLLEVKNEWKLAFLVFRWVGLKPEYRHSGGVYNLMIWILGKHKRFDIAWALIKNMHQSSVVKAETLLIMIKRYAAANDVQKAIKTFHAMENFKISADSTMFHTLLSALCKHRNVEEAEELIHLNKSFFPLETEGFNIVLNGWCNIIGDLMEAKRVWREMSKSCVTPDATSYTHMISCFSKAGNLFDSLRLYDEMKKRGWVPGLVVYNSLIYVLVRENCVKEAINIFDKIREAKLEPSVASYNSLIYPLCEAHRLEEAYHALNGMRETGLIPTIGTYHAFMEVENMDGILKLIGSMKEVECGPNPDTFLLIFRKLFGLGEPGIVLKMWKEMGKYGVIPDASHYNVLIHGLLSHSWHNNARFFLNEMKSKGLLGDPKIVKMLKESTAKNQRDRKGGYKKTHGHLLCKNSHVSGDRTKKKNAKVNSDLFTRKEINRAGHKKIGNSREQQKTSIHGNRECDLLN